MTRQDRVFARRLLKLADFLKKLPPERFNFGSWAGDDWKGKPDLSCGTTACALGWATTIPSFRKAGMRLFRASDDLNNRPWVGLADYQNSDDSAVKAGETIFGLSSDEFDFLFIPRTDISSFSLDAQQVLYGRTSQSGRASAKEVAEQIRYFVRHKYGKVDTKEAVKR